MSITLYTTAWGDYWNKYGSFWTENIKTLDPQPDRIIIVSDKPIESEFEVIVTDIPDRAVLSHFRNVAVDNSNTEWIVAADLDDEVYPNYIANLNSQCEVHTFSYDSTKGYTHFADKSIWDNMLNFENYNFTITGTSAIKLDTIRKCGGYPKIEFEDAGLWCNIRKNNSSVYFDSTARFLYNEEYESLSRCSTNHKNIELDQYFNLIKYM